MQKLKTKNNSSLIFLNYQYFLKNNNLKNNKFKLKQNLLQNNIFFKDQDTINVEFNNFQNSFLPYFNKKKIIYTIQTQYENHSLLNYNLNYNLLYYFTKLLLKKSKSRIKCRVINKKKKKIIISLFGLIFLIKQNKLNKNNRFFYNYNKKNKVNKKKKKNKFLGNFLRYKLRYLNFIIEKNTLSRKKYVQEIIKKIKK